MSAAPNTVTGVGAENPFVVIRDAETSTASTLVGRLSCAKAVPAKEQVAIRIAKCDQAKREIILSPLIRWLRHLMADLP